jgi:cathepsin X
VSLLTYIRNQNIPHYCEAGWAFAASTSLSDRIKIMRNATWPDIIIAPQVLISCATLADGCYGGDPIDAYQWISGNYITDESCSPFRARGYTNGFRCSNTTICKNCPGTGNNCYVPDSYMIYGIKEYGKVIAEEAMMTEIYENGPITCGIAVPDDFRYNYTSGIYEDKTNNLEVVHYVSIAGWGVEDGINYWFVRNSWGSYWGENGYFRIVRGKNNLGIESDCSYAIPEDTWTNNVVHNATDEEKNDPNNEIKNSAGGDVPEMFLGKKQSFQRCRRNYPLMSQGEKIHSVPPYQDPLKKFQTLPDNWDWRNIEGINYVTISKNQHIPIYCGSCWAHGPTSALADRFMMHDGGRTTPISLSTQVIVNCQPGAGSCFGGNPQDVYDFAYQYGIPDDSCQQYVAHNSPTPYCNPLQVCETCKSPAPDEDSDDKSTCSPVTNYKRYYAWEYGRVNGADNMKLELYERGPIDCGIEVTTSFHAYSGGVYHEHKDTPWEINHSIAVVGWGKEGELEYWIGRNSWGTYWGENGYFRIQMYKDNNAIEEDCGWAVPSYDKHDNTEELILLE